MTGIPSPALLGVERVVIACDFGSGFGTADQQKICAQIVRKAALVTDLPVRAATAGELARLSGAPAKQRLVLHVRATAEDIERGRKSLTVSVTPDRPMTGAGEIERLTSTASLVEVQGDWIVQGPIDAFNKLLGSTGGRRLRAPLTAD
jgi:hypothetical protein